MNAPVDAETQSEAQFAEIYKTHYRRVFGLCRYLLNSFDAAEDAAQESFLRAKAGFASYDPRLSVASWLLGIASHHCIDLLRRRGLEGRLFEPDNVPEPAARNRSPLTELLVRERGDAVRDALLQLPEKLRVPLALAYYGELSYDEIAEILSLKRTHVATLLFRAKQQMREKLKND
jgi:RNA polymerase sigma-70 factor (ECF subfamily)